MRSGIKSFLGSQKPLELTLYSGRPWSLDMWDLKGQHNLTRQSVASHRFLSLRTQHISALSLSSYPQYVAWLARPSVVEPDASWAARFLKSVL